MLLYSIKYFFIFLFTICTCVRIINYKSRTHFLKIMLIMQPFFTTIICLLFKAYFIDASYLIALISTWLTISILISQPNIAFIASTIALEISYILFVFSSFISTIIITPLLNNNIEHLHLILSIITPIIQASLSLGLFQFKRFRNGMPFLFLNTYNKVTLTICLTVAAITISILSNLSNLHLQSITPICFSLILAILIHWWQGQITKSYKRSLQLRELESLRMELEDKEKRITELSKHNEELGRLIHKDNKLIPAMEHAVHEYFITDFDTLDAAKEKAQTLLLEIEELSKNRHNIILEINNAHSKHYATGIPALDTLLNYMDKRALQEHIALSVHLGVDLSNYIPTTITSEDLTHLLSDLLENAIIACKGAANANIQLQFYKSEKAFVIEIADNGIPFEIDSLVNFGITKLTTHADSGGSGIGLMDIWKIKEKYFASIHITELEANTPFSKKIAIIFNKKHRYSISSKRKEQLMQASKRADLHIFD